MGKTARNTRDHETCHEYDIRNQIITDNNRPPSLFEKFCGVQPTICQIVSVQTNIGQGKWVEPIRQGVNARSQTSLNTINTFMKAE